MNSGIADVQDSVSPPPALPSARFKEIEKLALQAFDARAPRVCGTMTQAALSPRAQVRLQLEHVLEIGLHTQEPRASRRSTA